MANITGTEGNDKRIGTFENDIISGLGGNDTLQGGFGNDQLFGGLGDDQLFGENGNDQLFGSSGRDQLFGLGGNDVLSGGSGNDVLIGIGPFFENEFDTLTGGSGADIFVIGLAQGPFGYSGLDHAIIRDFNSFDGDRIAVQGSVSDYRFVSNQNVSGGAANDTQIFKGNDLFAIVDDKFVSSSNLFTNTGNNLF
ncbi:calcium-binding protein [Microcoleus sp. BROC3]|uniref:calcium-binding protein n=1 Tax=Microcoleus sp. BROC3 TaxID=3055323 RepID=UPI002FD0533D